MAKKDEKKNVVPEIGPNIWFREGFWKWTPEWTKKIVTPSQLWGHKKKSNRYISDFIAPILPKTC